MALGEPSAHLPNEITEYIAKEVKRKKYGYTDSIGIIDLRKKILKHYKKKYSLDISIENVAVTSGASAGIFLSLMTLFDKGDVVAISNPGYPCYKNIISALGLIVYYIDTNFEDNFQLTPSLVKKLPRSIKGLIISSPSNPCGTIIPNSDLLEINEICKKMKIRVISDEIYHGLNYNNIDLKTFYSLDDNSVVINSFSKYFLMTGFRLGWTIAKKNIIERIKHLSMNFYLSPPSISQSLALEVFNYYNYFDEVKKSYIFNRDFLIKSMQQLGLKDFVYPEGAFYLYIDISSIHNNSYEFCNNMVNEIGVTAAPGIDFDKVNGKNFIRISYPGNLDDIKKAISLIESWI